MESSQIVGKKHAFAYIVLMAGYGLLLFFPVVLFVYLITTTSWRVPAWLPLAVFGVIVFFSLLAFSALMDVKSFTWTIKEESVLEQCGWLPWKKRAFDYRYETIFEAYYTIGFFAKIFGYGHCVIRRTEGVTSTEEAGFFAHPATIVEAINQKVKECRARQRQPMMVSPGAPAVAAGKSAAEQIRELALLKAEGMLSEQEFESMKQTIIRGGVMS